VKDVSDQEWTTIRLHRGTTERLQKTGRKSETYDDIINQLIDEREAKA
jgi:hypothetical protein